MKYSIKIFKLTEFQLFLLGDFLDINRIKHLSLKIVSSLFNILSVIKETLEICKLYAKKKNITFQIFS
jgi:hypothetical protein